MQPDTARTGRWGFCRIFKHFAKRPAERSYAQQVLRFAEKIQYDLYYREVSNLVSQISLIEKLTVAG
jgi:hypothetical protein